jgi:hypothetical protein
MYVCMYVCMYVLRAYRSLIFDLKYHNFNMYKHGKPPLLCKKGTTYKIWILRKNQEDVSILIWQMFGEVR